MLFYIFFIFKKFFLIFDTFCAIIILIENLIAVKENNI